ncbi:MAG TPA: hypothetical protein VGH38_10135, partial [Bryobacteraceae bacterium]
PTQDTCSSVTVSAASIGKTFSNRLPKLPHPTIPLTDLTRESLSREPLRFDKPDSWAAEGDFAKDGQCPV